MQTLDVFLAEANLPPETGIVSKGSLTLEGVLEEKKVFDAGRDFEKIGIHDENELWKVPCACDSTMSSMATLPSLILNQRHRRLTQSRRSASHPTYCTCQ